MTRGNRILSTLIVLGLLMPGLNTVARSQSDAPTQESGKTFTISGNVGVPGVTLRGLPGNPVTDPQGGYQAQVDYGWSGTVTPMKVGYAFEPSSRQYMQVVQAQENQNYKARILAFTISGNAGLPGVSMRGFPDEVVTDESGRYSVSVSYGWSGQVTPSREGHTFQPVFRSYNRVAESLAQQDYKPGILTFKIDGQAGAPGVMMQGLPGNPVSDQQGNYRAQVEYGWAGVVVPHKQGFRFTPPQRTYYSVGGNLSNENYVAEERMVTISDVIKAGAEPIQDVKVTADPGGYTAMTNSRGRYSLKVPHGWSGSLSMSKPGFEFSGQVRYQNVTADTIDGKSVPAPEDWPPLPSRTPQAGGPGLEGNVLVIPTAEVVPEKVAQLTEDLRVMLQIFREKLSEPRMILGVLRDYGSLLGEDRRAEAIYLQGSAALFVIGGDFPQSFPTQQPGEGEPQSRPQGEAADPVWQRARQKLYSPGGVRSSGPSGQTQAMTFEQFKEELLRSLKHAANVRHIDPNELVVLTLVAQNEGASRAGEADLMRQYANVYGSDYMAMMGTGRPAPSTTVLTMQARKADIDAFAQGTLDFDQFRQKVRSFTY